MEPKPYLPVYDALHISYPPAKKDEEGEWWYFDADLSTGDKLVLMYSVNDTRIYPRTPSVRVDLYESDGTEHSLIKKFTYDEATFSAEKCEARYADGQYCVDAGDCYEVSALIEGYGCRLRFFGEVPPWMGGEDGTTGVSPDGGVKGWIAPQAMARVEGMLVKDGEEIAVTGTGYHDHNFSTYNTGNEIDHWHWGKVHTPELTLDYSVLYPRMEGVPPVCIVLAEGPNDFYCEPRDAFHQAGGVKVRMLDEKIEPELGLTFAHRFVIDVATDEIKFTLDVAVDRFVMKQRSEDLPTGGESAYRYIGTEKLTIEKGGQTKTYDTHSLHEVVFPHPPKAMA